MSRAKKAKAKNRSRKIIQLEEAMDGGTRVQKIEALGDLGYRVNKKTPGIRVDKKVSEVAEAIGEELKEKEERRFLRNRRKRTSKRRK